MECPEIENFTPKVVYRVADHTRSKLHKLREDVNKTPSRKPKIHSNEQDPFSTPAGQFSESTIFDDDSPHFAQQSARTDVPESISPITKTTMKQYPSADDEEIVNAALVQFLSTVTMHFVPNAHWTHKRKAFQIGNKKDDNGFEARVDGFLRRRSDDTVLSIIEVKPCVRLRQRPNIRMQESAQMAAWIASFPDNCTGQDSNGNFT